MLAFDTAVRPVLASHFITLSGVDRQVRALTKLPPPDEPLDSDAADEAIISTTAEFLEAGAEQRAARPAAPATRRFGRRSKQPVVGLPFTKHAKGVIQHAFKESLIRHDKSVRVGHLAIALLDTAECLGLTIIERSGADLAQLRTAFEAALDQS